MGNGEWGPRFARDDYGEWGVIFEGTLPICNLVKIVTNPFMSHFALAHDVKELIT